jgi:hypothetical protein
MVECAFIIDLYLTAEHSINEYGRPPPSEFASGAPGLEEGHLRLEPEPFLFGSQMFLFSLLHPLGVFRSSDSKFF